MYVWWVYRDSGWCIVITFVSLAIVNSTLSPMQRIWGRYRYRYIYIWGGGGWAGIEIQFDFYIMKVEHNRAISRRWYKDRSLGPDIENQDRRVCL